QAGAKLVSCPVCVRCLFVLPRNATAPDRGMLLRCVLDALRGVAWVDDRQVVSEIVDIEYGDIPGVEISVSAADRRSNPA
ncbi:MAG TPA: RusA family crossover junction endodeoxyribonuclease, partial [Methanoregulaceae archaeon]|nr:RusA family crossover junction endodeoxyribonuclease [Methanoregulaceae archaeon]